MSNTALGAALTIDDSVLAKIQEAENKIIRLEQTTRTSADKITKSFRSAGDAGIQYFIEKLKLAQTELNKINVPKIDFGQSINFGKVSQQATLLAESVTRASVAINKYYSATQKSNRKTDISADAERKAYIEKYEMYKKMFDQIERNEKRAIKAAENEAKAQERAAQRIIAAENRKYAEQVKLYQQQNLQKNTTYQGALAFSESATSINQRTKAIQYLTQARAQLSTTDANYTQKLNALNSAIKRMNAENEKAVQGARNLAQQHSNLMNTSDQLARKLALIFSVSQIQGYVNKLIQVRGEFELQNTALASILQNKDQADRLFAQITELAVQSPFTIKELTTYTKSLSAYSVEYEKLYDTTKMLADVASGLGVDMQRLILAFGQVKAANFLRGTETRQFTEAGINMLGELAKYYSELEGRIVSVGEVQDRQFKKMISFQDVEQVFKRLTSSGGMFYQMQERQAETLSGMMSNLTDRIDIMLNTIGKENESAIKGTIKVVQSLVSNYDAIVNTTKAAVAAFGAYKVAVLLSKQSLIEFAAANGIVSNAGVKQLTILQLLDVGFKKLSISLKTVAASFKSLFVSNPWLLALTAISTALYEVITWNDEYNEQLDKINKKHNESAASLNKIADAYDKISEKAKQAAKSQDNFVYKEDDFKSLFAQLQKLDEQLKDRGYNLPIRIELVTPKNIDEAFKGGTEILKMANDFGAEFRKSMEEGMNATEGWFNIFGDNLGTDLKELSDAYSEIGGAFKSNLSDVENEVESISDKLTGSARGYYEELKKGQKENEDDFDWTLRKVDLLAKIRNAQNDLRESDRASLITNKQLNDLISKRLDISNAEKEVQYELNKYLDKLIDKYGGLENLKKAYNDNPLVIKTEIDRYFEEKELNAQAKRFASFWAAQRLQIPIEFETRAEMPTFFNDFRDTVKTLDTKGIFTKQLEGLTSLTDLEQLLQKTYKDIMKDQDVLNRANTKQLDLSKQIAEQKERINSANEDERDAAQVTLNNLEKQKSVIDKTITSANEKNKETIAIIKAIASAFNLMYQSQSKSGTGAEKTSQVFKDRLSFFERANKEYEKLLQNYSKEEARAKVISSMLDEAQQRGVGDIFIKAQFDEKGTLDSMNKVKAMYKSLSQEMRIEFAKAFGGIQLDMDIEVRQDRVKEIQNQFSDLFGNYELSLELDKLGLDKDLMSQLFGVQVFDLSQLRKVLEPFKNELQNTLGTDGVSAWEEMNKKISEAEERELQDRLKTYSQYLKKSVSERVAIEMEAQKKIAEVRATQEFTPEQQDRIVNQISQEAQVKKDEQAWKEFQDSELYIKMFEDLEFASTKALDAMEEKLVQYRNSLKSLSPTELKQVTEQLEKIRDIKISRNPFEGFKDNVKDYIEYLKKADELNTKFIESQKKESDLSNLYDNQSRLRNEIESQYSAAVKVNGEGSKEALLLKNKLTQQDKILSTVLDQLVAQKKITKEFADQIRNGEQLGQSLSGRFQQIGGYATEIASGVTDIASSLENVFGTMDDKTADIVSSFAEIANGVGNTVSGIGRAIANPADIGGYIQALSGLASTIGAIFQIGDKKKEREIQRQIEMVENLQRAYEKLEKAIDDAYSIDTLEKSTDQAIANLEAQNESYQNMIASERDKKKTDEDRIKEWEQAIEDNKEAIQELTEQRIESLGGLGSIENMKSAAQEFIDAWYDAYRETGDGLEGLNEQFDEFVDNTLKKQLMLRATEKYLEGFFKKFDSMFEDGVVSGSEMSNIRGEWDKVSGELSDFLSELSKELGVEIGQNTEDSMSSVVDDMQSTAEGFVQAWMDAYRETGNGLEALGEQWDEYIIGIIQKQMMIQGMKKYLEPIFNMIDSMLADEVFSAEDSAQIKQEFDKILPQLNELWKNMAESFNIPSDSEFKENLESSAQSFANAWLSAYKETGEGLEALEEQWDSYFDNIVTNQLMMKGTEKFLEPLMRMMDEMLEDSILTPEEVASIQEQASSILPQLDELWKSIAESFKIPSNEQGQEDAQKEIEDFNNEVQSTAEDFADAWLKAYKETGDGLDALGEQFDQYIENIIKKQMALRATEKFIEPIMKQVEEMLEDNIFSEEENKIIQQKIDEIIPKLNEFWKQIAEGFEIPVENTEQEDKENEFVENMKDSAQEFADAWLEAYKETGDGLDKLNEKWDEYIEDIISKQLMLRGLDNYLEPIFRMIDNMTSDNVFTPEEAASIQEKIDQLMPELNEFWKAIAESFGITGETADNMTGLSKSISGITEEQADALSAITESIRYFSSDSNLQLRSILATLTAPAPENPFLLELKAQTEQLRTMNSLWSRIVKSENGSIALNVRIK